MNKAATANDLTDQDSTAKAKATTSQMLKRHAVTRLVGMVGSTGIGVAYIYLEQARVSWPWLVLLYTSLIHTPLWYYICGKSNNPVQAEKRVMLLDVFFFGHYIVMAHFQPWVVFGWLMVLIINSLTGGSIRILLLAFPSLIAGMLVTLPIEGFHFQKESSLVIILLCMVGLAVYISYTAYVAGKSLKDLRVSRRQMKEQARALQMSNECLEQSISDLKQASFALAQSEQDRIAAEIREKTKAAFLANMSHELRTPMNGVMGMLSLMGTTSLDDEQQNYLYTANNSAKTLLLLLDDILDYSKLEAGNIGLDNTTFEIDHLIEEVLQIFGEEALSKNVDLVYWHDYGINYALNGDSYRLKQVFTNLVGNAIKYTPQGHIVVRSRIVGEDSDKYRIRFEVEDTGIGISDAKQTQVFDAFYQADQSNSRKYGGAGLGLALCREVIRHMDGSIGVESEEGRGSTFWFEVPLSKNPERLYNLKPNFSGIMLVVDPNVISRDNLRHRAKALGCDVIAVGRWQEAEALLEREQHDVILLIDLEATESSDFRLWRTGNKSQAISWALMGCNSRRYDLPSWLKGLSPQYISKPIRQKELAQYLSLHKPRVVKNTAIEKPSETKFGEGHHVLVVEDNKVNQRVAVARLQKLGFLVDVADQGEQATEMVLSRSYDVIFMDCQMPIMDGFEATRQIRVLEGEGRIAKVPIIAMTAHVMNEDRQQCFDCGMNDFLRKPVTQEHLVETLLKWLNARKSDQGFINA